MNKFRALPAILAIGLPVSAVAQTSGLADSHPLRGKHEVALSLGFLSDVNVESGVSVAGVTTKSEVSGFIGSLAYSYWLTNEWAFNLSAGVANADASTSVGGLSSSVESAMVVPLLFGVKYKPLELAVGDALRPYLSASIGPYFGFASDVRVGAGTRTESYSQTAFGSRAVIGMDLSVNRRFMLGFAAGYRLVSDFERRVGSDKNYSSPEFSLSLGLILGGGTE